MRPMPPTDSLFLLAERRERPMHVGGLHLYRPPEDAPPDHVARLWREAVASASTVHPLLRRRAARAFGLPGMWMWEDDRDLDLEYHVRHSALPTPGRVRELLALCSRLHGTLLDRSRPLWETHLIEGLDDGRFATYTKIHHALVDGVSAMRLLERGLSADPSARGMPPPFARVERPRHERGAASKAGPRDIAGAGLDALRGAVGAGDAALRTLWASFNDQANAFPFKAPPSVLNVPITGARRFAAQGWPIARLKAVSTQLGGTLNDVVLAMSGGALRRYLLDLDALPDDPLVAMVPVSLRDDDAADGGVKVGVILCNLATHLADPAERFALVHRSSEVGKLRLQGLTQSGALLLSALSFAPLGLGPLFRYEPLRKPPFNIVISNVPGPRQPLYWNGAELVGVYPSSIPSDGQALNITVASYAGRLGFGLVGDRQALPSLQRLLEHLETSLTELEGLTGA